MKFHNVYFSILIFITIKLFYEKEVLLISL